jgi:hypothetical protein
MGDRESDFCEIGPEGKVDANVLGVFGSQNEAANLAGRTVRLTERLVLSR